MGSAPSPPDPMKTATAQGIANTNASVAAGIVNNPNQYTPWGSQVYKPTGKFTTITNPDGTTQRVERQDLITKLTPDQMRLMNQQEKLGMSLNRTAIDQVGRISGLLNSPINTEGMQGWARPELQTSFADAGTIQRDVGANDWSADRRRVEDAIMSRYDEQFAKDQSSREARLAAQGVAAGSEGWRNSAFDAEKARTDARMQAILAGGEEQSRLAGLELAQGGFRNAAQQQAYGQLRDRAGFSNQAQLAGAGFDNALRGQQLQEMLTLRNQPINEIAALMSGGQVTVPQFNAPYRQGIDPAPVADSVYNSYALEAANAQNQMSGLFGLGSSFLGALPMMLSDEREKKDVKPAGKTPGGAKVYSYRYKRDPRGLMHFGVMAQEEEKRNSAAVKTVGGRKMVDYAKVA